MVNCVTYRGKFGIYGMYCPKEKKRRMDEDGGGGTGGKLLRGVKRLTKFGGSECPTGLSKSLERNKKIYIYVSHLPCGVLMTCSVAMLPS